MNYPEAVGLTNLGNTCYINSVVQSLYLSDAFHHAIVSLRLTPEEQRAHPQLRALHHLFGMMRYHTPSSHQPDISPKSFHQILPAPFNEGSQQDADEFAKYLLDTVNEQLKDVIKQRSGSKRKVHSLTQDAAPPSNNQPSKSLVSESAGGALNGGDARSQSPDAKRPSKKHILISTTMSVTNQSSTSSNKLPATISASSLSQPINLKQSTQPISQTTKPSILIPPLPAPSTSPPLPAFDPALDIDPYFGGVWCSEIECLRCNNQSFKKEAFLDVPLPLQQLDDEQEIQLVQRISAMRQQAKDGTYDETDSHVKVQLITPSTSNQQSSMITDSSVAKPPCESSVPRSLPKDVMSRIAQFSALTQQFGDAFSSRDRVSKRSEPLDALDTASKSTILSSVVPMDIDSHLPNDQPDSTSSANQQVSTTPVVASSPAMLLASMLTRVVAETAMFATVTAATSFAALQAKATEMQLQQQGQLAASPPDLATEDKSQALVPYVGPPAEDKNQALVLYTGTPSGSSSSTLLSSSSSSTLSSSSSSSTASKASWSAASDAARSQSLSDTSTANSSAELVLASSEPPVTHSSAAGLQLTSMLRCYFSPELLTGSDRYHCDRCHSKQNALKSLSIRQAPRHLLICLKRNEYDPAARARRKLMNEVKYPCTLTLPVTEEGPNGKVQIDARYVLYSVVIHSGTSAERGHYYAIARHSDEARQLVRSAPDATISLESLARKGDFISLNDSTVDRVTFTHLAQLTKRKPHDLPYLLFYRRFDLDDNVEADPNRDLPVNPMLQRLAELEALRQKTKREKEAKESLVKLLNTLPKVEPYQPPAEEWTDPDM